MGMLESESSIISVVIGFVSVCDGMCVSRHVCDGMCVRAYVGNRKGCGR